MFEKLLAPLPFAAGAGEMADMFRWVNEGQRSSNYTTAETILAAFANPRMLEATSKAQYTPAGLLDGKANTLYLCAPTHEQERLRPLFAAMVSELAALVFESSAQTGKPIDPPLLIVLDEAANIAPLHDLAALASTGAGQGIQLLTVFQDAAQVHTQYGHQAQTILNNHRAKVFCGGIADPKTIRLIDQVVGEGEFRQRSETAGQKGSGSATEASTYRSLAPPISSAARSRAAAAGVWAPSAGPTAPASLVRRQRPDRTRGDGERNVT